MAIMLIVFYCQKVRIICLYWLKRAFWDEKHRNQQQRKQDWASECLQMRGATVEPSPSIPSQPTTFGHHERFLEHKVWDNHQKHVQRNGNQGKQWMRHHAPIRVYNSRTHPPSHPSRSSAHPRTPSPAGMFLHASWKFLMNSFYLNICTYCRERAGRPTEQVVLLSPWEVGRGGGWAVGGGCGDARGNVLGNF